MIELPISTPVSREEQFEELVQRQSRFVFRVAYAILRSSPDAADVVQDTFLKVFRNGNWEAIQDERAFLARVAWRLAVGRRRKVWGMKLEQEATSQELDPEAAAAASDWTATVHRMIDTLPEDLRQPLALSGLREMNSREIAGAMNISEGTVRTRLVRARLLLKQKLASYS